MPTSGFKLIHEAIEYLESATQTLLKVGLSIQSWSSNNSSIVARSLSDKFVDSSFSNRKSLTPQDSSRTIDSLLLLCQKQISNIYIFDVASTQQYGAVAYLYSDNNIELTLSKFRVSSLKDRARKQKRTLTHLKQQGEGRLLFPSLAPLKLPLQM